MNPAVVISELSFSYPAYGRPPEALFSRLSLAVSQGGIHVVCGEPGSGKSTLSLIVAGLVPQYSGGTFSGDITIFGTPAADIAYHELVPLLSLVMQNSDSQIVTTSCEEEAAFPLESLGMDRREMKSRVAAALEFFGMSAFRHREPAELSGGEKKKLMLAVSYAVDAPLLVLDESLEEIDPEFRRKYVQYLKTSGKTVIYFASKIDDILSEAADYWFELSDGAVRESNRESISRTFRFSSSPFEPFPEPAESLRIKNLTFSYSGGFSINIADLHLRAGEITALVGRNGSGKTTLCRILSGLIKPDGGRIEILGGEGWEAADPDILSAWSGYLFQNPDYQIFLPTIDEEIAYGLKRSRVPAQQRKELTDHARETFELPGGTVPPSVLSYGERKQLQAAVYSVLPKGIYIFDEIDSALSFPMIRRMLSAFYRRDVVIVVITHQMEFARGIARRVITMDQGSISEDRQISGEGI